MVNHPNRSKQQKATPTLKVEVNDWVLLGSTRASYPGEWCVGRVLWVGDNDLLVERSNQHGETWRDHKFMSDIRAVGDLGDLFTIKEQARIGVKALREAVAEAEQALGAARNALFAKLEELAAGGLKVVPPDFNAIHVDEANYRGFVEQAEEMIADA